MRNIKVTIEYDGTNYHGWQSQNNAIAIADVVSKAASTLTNEDIKVIGASRTDVGVHAYGQVANFKTESRIPVEKFAIALNTKLPNDVVARKAEEVDETFHSRFSSIGKKYKYIIYNDKMPSAIIRNRAYHVITPLDVDQMKRAAEFLQGTKDFKAFRASGCSAMSTIRTISKSMIISDGDTITYEIEGNGFLYNMVRIIAGTLIYVGLGKIRCDEIPNIIERKDRRLAGKTAPAHGLYLVEVLF